MIHCTKSGEPVDSIILIDHQDSTRFLERLPNRLEIHGLKRRIFMDAFIGLDPQETNWRFDGAVLSAELVRHWPEATTRGISDEKRKYSLEWSISLSASPGKMLNGCLSRTGVRIAIKGTTKDFAKFALWVRGLVPEKIVLKRSDDQHPDSMEIQSDTSEELIIQTFEA